MLGVVNQSEGGAPSELRAHDLIVPPPVKGFLHHFWFFFGLGLWPILMCFDFFLYFSFLDVSPCFDFIFSWVGQLIYLDNFLEKAVNFNSQREHSLVIYISKSTQFSYFRANQILVLIRCVWCCTNVLKNSVSNDTQFCISSNSSQKFADRVISNQRAKNIFE